MQKFIFVTGGVLSGLGKGVVAASIGPGLAKAALALRVDGTAAIGAGCDIR